ncbi:MAG: leucine-rich repeat domain-containing protein [Lachnospiraceae bacterium]
MDINLYRKYEPFFGTWYFDGEDCILGSGSFASVFRIIRHDASVKPCALKILTIPKSETEINMHRSEGMDDAGIQRYYHHMADDIKKEYELMSELKGCNNIVSCEDFMAFRHEDGFGFDIVIRMEFLEPLVTFELENNIDNLVVIKLGIDMCNALERCSIKNIIHRDIKPDNIFISSMGDFKLGDFGIARTMDNTVMMMSRKGTPNYMAPEVYFSKPYDNTADIYSLGIVLYRMLNNMRIPFLPLDAKELSSSDRENAFKRRIINGEMLPRPCYGDEALKSIVLKACAYNKNDRYQHPEEMRRHLEMVRDALLQGESVPDEFAAALDSTIAISITDNTGFITQDKVNPENTNIKNNFLQPGKLKFVLAGMALLALFISVVFFWQARGRNTEEAENISSTSNIKNIVQEKTSLPEETPRDKRLDITELDAKKDKINNLKELEYYKNLKVLSLKDYGLKDTSKLQELKGLVYLDLSGNKNLGDLTGIKEMGLLTSLDLRETAVSDIEVISSLKSLKYIDISYTLIEDASPLKECTKLEVLYAGYNNENFADSSIMEVAASLKNLKELDLTGNTAITGGMDNLEKLKGLVCLKLGGTFINNKQCKYLEGLKSLEVLSLQSNINITDFKSIKKLENLKELDLSATGITDIKGIEKLKNLKKLDLSLTFIEDISMLYKLKNLKHLVLAGSESINKQAKALKKSMPGCEIEIQ